MILYADSHAHLGARDYDADRCDAVERAISAGVTLISNCTDSLDDFPGTLELMARYPSVCLSCLGLHPDSVDRGESHLREGLSQMERHLDVVSAVGEIGLDYHYSSGEDNRARQRHLFETMLDFAVDHSLPVVVHSREAEEDTLRILKEKHPVSLYMHCFAGNIEFAERILEAFPDAYFGITGIVTFRSADTLREVVDYLPLTRILIETDSPCLSPIPYRGRRNEPSRVTLVAERIAQIKGLSVEDVASVTLDNSRRFFHV